MQRYESHKIVEACKIVDLGSRSVAIDNGETVPLVPEDVERIGLIMRRHLTDKGYLVKYVDGYLSWSPTKAFEEGYTKMEFGK